MNGTPDTLSPKTIHGDSPQTENQESIGIPGPETQQVFLPEVDVSQIVRPELFHTPSVSGVAIPVAQIVGDKPVGRWETYLRWHANSRRERCDLAPSIALPDGGQLWVHPTPPEPAVTMRLGWTRESRQSWLQGAEAPNPIELFRRICEQIEHFLEFPADSATAITRTLALWAMFTYLYPAWPAVPYLSIGGQVETGKSTLFRVLSRIVFRPLESSNMTAALLFRTLEERGGTLLLDEAERLKEGTPGVTELRTILLSGYKPGSPARRLERMGDSFKPREFDVFGPKAMAAVESLPAPLLSRCIPIVMFRAAPCSPKPRRRLDEDPAIWASIRDDLHVLALEYGATWGQLARRSDVVPAKLNGRDYELWQPLLALTVWLEEHAQTVTNVTGVTAFQGISTSMQEHAVRTAEANHDDRVPYAEETLLRLLAEAVMAKEHLRLEPAGLLQRAQELDKDTFVDSGWTGQRVGYALKRYGVSSRGSSSRRTYRDVTVDQLRRIQESYGLNLGIKPVTPATPDATESQADGRA